MSRIASYFEAIPYKGFFLWLAGFYSVWLLIVCGGDQFQEVIDHWPAAVAMIFGSYFAGATPMGGGTVGFPAMVLLLDEPASLGRNFALAIQSVGMISASFFLVCTKRPLDLRFIKWGCLGALIGTPLGALFVGPFLSDLWVKMVFAIICASFGLLHLLKLDEFTAPRNGLCICFRSDNKIGLVVGIMGGILASVIGVGIDMLFYMLMVIVYRIDLKIAVPTSVILMAITSVVGISSNLVLNEFMGPRYTMSPALYYHWLAAAPIVAIGAPLGSYVVGKIARKATLITVSVLCALQFVVICCYEQVSITTLLSAVAMIALIQLLLNRAYSMSEAIAANQ